MAAPPLIVPTLSAGPFRLRPWHLTDLAAVREAFVGPYIPLGTTVPAGAGRDDAADRERADRNALADRA
ncbi:hypothetical protein ACH4E7_05295 [Kitasatospora sp. NPDC018058]|uniref:hypothetical protein n=1 Tax=Kitasatospora sp. NPDC018058 TaxID=3364025 RepID=UPI0037C12B4C